MCKLKGLSSAEYYDSENIVARLNLPNMAYPPEDRLEMYLAAQTGLARLETSPEKQRKYSDFIDFYADLSEEEVVLYRDRYLSEKGDIMGLARGIGVKSTLSSCSFFLSSIQSVTGFFILDHLTFFLLSIEMFGHSKLLSKQIERAKSRFDPFIK